MRQFLFLSILSVFLFTSCASGNKLHKTVKVNKLGNRKVKIITLATDQPGLLFYNMHENENTSVKAAKKYLRSNNGKIVYLKHNGKRNISFVLNGEKYQVDPNRIYSDVGIEKTLKKFKNYSPEAQAEVKSFAEDVLVFLDVDNLDKIVALHNNTEHNYSMFSYMPGGAYANEVEQIYYVPFSDPDDFYFVTDQQIFEALDAKKINVALQDNSLVTDDGSLSVYCGQKNINYINVEAQHGHKKEQYYMLKLLDGVLQNY